MRLLLALIATICSAASVNAGWIFTESSVLDDGGFVVGFSARVTDLGPQTDDSYLLRFTLKNTSQVRETTFQGDTVVVPVIDRFGFELTPSATLSSTTNGDLDGKQLAIFNFDYDQTTTNSDWSISFDDGSVTYDYIGDDNGNGSGYGLRAMETLSFDMRFSEDFIELASTQSDYFSSASPFAPFFSPDTDLSDGGRDGVKGIAGFGGKYGEVGVSFQSTSEVESTVSNPNGDTEGSLQLAGFWEAPTNSPRDMVPEPASLALWGVLGLGMLGSRRRRPSKAA